MALRFKDINDWKPSSISIVDKPGHPMAVFEVYEDDDGFIKKYAPIEVGNFNNEEKTENGNEWAMVFNLDKGKFEKLSDYKPENLYTDEKQDSVNPLKQRDFGEDELIVLHNHQDGTFLSPSDFAMGFFRSENIKYVLVHTNDYIYY